MQSGKSDLMIKAEELDKRVRAYDDAEDNGADSNDLADMWEEMVEACSLLWQAIDDITRDRR